MRKLKYEQLEKRHMLNGFLGWQMNYGSIAEFPENDYNYDQTVDAADLAPSLDSGVVWLGDPPPVEAPDPPTGLIRAVDQMETLIDDSTVLAAMNNPPGKHVKHIPVEHRLWIKVLGASVEVEGTIRYHTRANGDISVQADLTDIDNGDVRLTDYRRNILITPNGTLNVSGKTNFHTPTDIYNAEIRPHGWMLRRHRHQESTPAVNENYTEWYELGQKYHKTGYSEGITNTTEVDGSIERDTIGTVRDEWTGPVKPTTKTVDATVSDYRVHDQHRLLSQKVVTDTDTVMTYQSQVFQGWWTTTEMDKDLTEKVTTDDYAVTINTSTQVGSTIEHETKKWFIGALQGLTNLSITDSYNPDAVAYNMLAYTDGTHDFSRGFTYDEDGLITDFDAEYGDQRLAFIAHTTRYHLVDDTHGITTASELAERVEWYKAQEAEILPEGIESTAYPDINVNLAVLGV